MTYDERQETSAYGWDTRQISVLKKQAERAPGRELGVSLADDCKNLQSG